MRWHLEHYEGRLPLDTVTSDEMAWDQLDLETVQRIRVSVGGYTIILQGMDYYWLDEVRKEFGQFVDTSNDHIYTGIRRASFKIERGQIINTGGYLPRLGVNVVGSCYMPDKEAREVGIL